MKNLNKIIGWVLVFAGVAVIFWTLSFSHGIFTAKTDPPLLFEAEVTENDSLIEERRTLTSEEDIQEEMGRIIQEQLTELIPSDILYKSLNLMAWSIFAGILIFAGSSIAGVGIKLIGV